MFSWLSANTFAVVFCAVLLGGMVAFTFFVIPVLRRALKRQLVRDLLQRLFPAYYHYCTGFAVAAGIACALTPYRREAIALAILGATFVFARTHLLRAIRALQPDTNQEPDLRFRLVHGFSMLLNLAQIVIAAILLVRIS